MKLYKLALGAALLAMSAGAMALDQKGKGEVVKMLNAPHVALATPAVVDPLQNVGFERVTVDVIKALPDSTNFVIYNGGGYGEMFNNGLVYKPEFDRFIGFASFSYDRFMAQTNALLLLQALMPQTSEVFEQLPENRKAAAWEIVKRHIGNMQQISLVDLGGSPYVLKLGDGVAWHYKLRTGDIKKIDPWILNREDLDAKTELSGLMQK